MYEILEQKQHVIKLNFFLQTEILQICLPTFMPSSYDRDTATRLMALKVSLVTFFQKVDENFKI